MEYLDPVISGAREISKCIQAALYNDEGALIGRNGTIELEQMTGFRQDKLIILRNNAGIFPYTSFHLWKNQCIDATKEADILATGWYEPLKYAEQIALKEWKSNAIQVPLRSLEPYYVSQEEQWIRYFSGHSVSVVTCFTKTAMKQVDNLKNIWGPVINWPSDISWNWVQTGHPPSVAEGVNEWPSNINDSIQAINWIVSEVIKQGSRFAIIGCGGIGMPVALKLKERGVICIVLGGAIQVLFGIKGRRWENHSVISKFWNEHWVSPSEAETPAGSSAIEGGCYW